MIKSALASLMLFGTGVLFVFLAIHAANKRGHADESDPVYGELLELRKSIGGSVLSGTSLAPSPESAEREFRETLKRTVRQKSTNLPREKSDFKPATSENTPASVVTLRHQGSKLDRIADAIEQLREYAHADALRESADTLRNLARELDSASPPVAQRKSSAAPTLPTSPPGQPTSTARTD